MGQQLITFAAAPGREDMMTVDVTVVSTRSSRMLWSITVAQPDEKVTKRKGVDDPPSTISAATTTVIADQLFGKLQFSLVCSPCMIPCAHYRSVLFNYSFRPHGVLNTNATPTFHNSRS